MCAGDRLNEDFRHMMTDLSIDYMDQIRIYLESGKLEDYCKALGKVDYLNKSIKFMISSCRMDRGKLGGNYGSRNREEAH